MKHRRSNLKTSITDTKTFVVDVLNVLVFAEQTARVVSETYPSTRLCDRQEEKESLL